MIYTLNNINSFVFKSTNNWWENHIICYESAGYDIDVTLSNIYSFIIEHQESPTYKIAVNEDAFSKLMNTINKRQCVSSPEYITQNVRFTNKSKTDKSFYDKDTIIEIKKEDGRSIISGIIRISDHDVDLDQWAKNNRNNDFGISIVIEEEHCEYNGNDIITVPDRSISIYEYDFNINRKNIGELNKIIYSLLKIKKDKFIDISKPINGKVPIHRQSVSEQIKTIIEKYYKTTKVT